MTVKQRQYYVYRYESNFNGIEIAVVLLTYYKMHLKKLKIRELLSA